MFSPGLACRNRTYNISLEGMCYIHLTNARLLLVVPLQGIEPCRSSPSDQSPRFIRPRRTPVLSGVELYWKS